MAIFTIAGLTLTEAVRRRTLLGALLLGLLILSLSLMLLIIRSRFEYLVSTGARDRIWLSYQIVFARSIIINLCLFTIRTLGSIFAILLAGGAISGEIERGLLAVILPKPIPRWQILAGKWIGLNVLLAGSVFVWSVLVWISLSWQAHENLLPLLTAGGYLTLFPIVISTLTLTLSTVAQRLLGTSLALAVSAFAWFDGVLNALGTNFDTDVLHNLANFASVLMPQGCIAWWIKDAVEEITPLPPKANFQLGVSPQFVKEWGFAHLHTAHLDAVYLVAYVLVVFLIGTVIFQKRDV